MQVSRAFTTTNTCIVRQLRNDAEIRHDGMSCVAHSLWDTGATSSCVSKRVIKDLSLVPTGKTLMHTPSGEKEADIFLVDIMLPNNVLVENVRVCESEIGDQGIDLLIGMDIIGQGDFAVSNKKITLFSFRMPSEKVIDFVKDIRLTNAIGQKHGGGKGRRRKKR